MQVRPSARPLLAGLALAGPLLAHAQVTQKPDGQWRALFTLGATAARGNTHTDSASLQADVVRLTDHDKWSFDANGQYASSDGARTANRQRGTALYSRDFDPRWFGFGQLDLLHDPFADIRSRATLGSGVGYHAIKEDRLTWDLSAGVGYTMDRYAPPVLVDDERRSTYNHADVLLAEESNHKFTETTTFHQKLTVYPSLRDHDDVRTLFDAGLSVAMTKRIALTAAFEHRYDSRPAAGLGRNDTQLVTGVSLRFD
jgi:putative salt-induced outer membrane protein YdiY